MSIYIPYTYRITSKTTGQHYYGARWGKNCCPADLWVSYFTSSKYVKELIDLHGKEDFVVEIRKTFDTDEKTIKWESTVLKRLNVTNNDFWLNRHDTHNFFHAKGVSSPKPAGFGLKISKIRKGIPHSQERKDNISKNHHNVCGTKNPTYGKKYISKGKNVKVIPKNEVNYYLNRGWVLGNNNSKGHKGVPGNQYAKNNKGLMSWVYNPIEKKSMMVKTTDMPQYISKGYIKGRVKI